MKGVAIWIERVGAVFDSFTLRLASVSALATLCMVILIAGDLFARNVMRASIPGAAEISTTLLVFMVYCGLAGAQAAKGHFNITFVLMLLPPRLRWVLDVAALALLCLITASLCWLTGGSAVSSYLRGESSWGIVIVPIWPARIAITVGFALLSLQALLDCLRATTRGPYVGAAVSKEN